jgi:hypothetical protein
MRLHRSIVEMLEPELSEFLETPGVEEVRLKFIGAFRAAARRVDESLREILLENSSLVFYNAA